MCNRESVQTVRFFRFMRLFQISLFSIVSIESDYIDAIVAWKEDCVKGLPKPEDIQKVRWKFDDDPVTEDALTIGECAYEFGWIDIDKLNINLKIISDKLGWKRERIETSINKLKEIKVIMIDDNDESDVFLLHE